MPDRLMTCCRYISGVCMCYAAGAFCLMIVSCIKTVACLLRICMDTVSTEKSTSEKAILLPWIILPALSRSCIRVYQGTERSFL